MTLKLARDRIAAEIAALDSLLSTLPPNDFLGRLGLEFRRKEFSERFGQLANQEERRAKVALFFGGDPVVGNLGVQTSFATNVVGSFQDLLSKVWGTVEGRDVSAMGPIKDKAASQLHITSLMHESFGFLLEELDESEPLFKTSLSEAADRTAEYIESFADEDERRFSRVIDEMHPRVFQSLQEFFGYLHRGKATFRLVAGERDETFDRKAVERAWHRAEASKVEEDRIEVQGRLLGVVPIQRRFEFEPDGSPMVIEGKVGEQFSQNYLERIGEEQFAGRRWKALLHNRLVVKVGRRPTETYTLLELDELEPKAGAGKLSRLQL